jgi:hypothetical protein
MSYRDVYPVDEETLADLVYFFDAPQEPGVAQHLKKAAKIFLQWREAFWVDKRPILTILEDHDDRILVADTRSCTEVEQHELYGLSAALIRALDRPVSHTGVTRRLVKFSATSWPEKEVTRALLQLVEKKLVWRSDTQYVALPTRKPLHDMQDIAEEIIGKIHISRYFKDRARFQQAFGGPASLVAKRTLRG